jgi:uncharacterized protein with GYD domain
VEVLFFIVLGKYRKKPTKETVGNATELFGQLTKEGLKFIGQYWTLGRYDTVSMVEAQDEKTLLKALMRFADVISTETLVALPREEAIKLVE